MQMNKGMLLIIGLLFTAGHMRAQGLGAKPAYIKRLTPEWKGERSSDGLPKVAYFILERLQNCTLEQI